MNSEPRGAKLEFFAPSSPQRTIPLSLALVEGIIYRKAWVFTMKNRGVP
jgi:hypothetical protein